MTSRGFDARLGKMVERLDELGFEGLSINQSQNSPTLLRLIEDEIAVPQHPHYETFRKGRYRKRVYVLPHYDLRSQFYNPVNKALLHPHAGEVLKFFARFAQRTRKSSPHPELTDLLAREDILQRRTFSEKLSRASHTDLLHINEEYRPIYQGKFKEV